MNASAPTGVGLGLRLPFADDLLASPPPELRFLEIHPENYVMRGGKYPAMLERCVERWPVLTHGLTLCLGSVEPFERAYVAALRQLLRRVRAPWHSEHLCFGEVDGVMLHDLVPLPLDRETVRTAVARLRELEDALELPIAVEHISYYALPGAATATDEASLLGEVLERADAKLLLDVNNVYVNAKNHGFDASAFIERLPLDRVVQIHVAGHSLPRPADGVIVDTHAEPIVDDVYALLERALERIGRPVPVLLERDASFPPFSELAAELARLDALCSAHAVIV